MIDLDEKYIDFIKLGVAKYLSNCSIYLFGSRVKGCAKKYSDIDIALSCDDLDDNVLLKIKSEFADSALPYEVDVIDLNNISEVFKSHIINDLVKI